TQIREGDPLETSSGSFGTVEAISYPERTIDIKKRGAMAEVHATSVFVHTIVDSTMLADSLLRLGAWVADHAVDGPGPFRAGRDLLLRNAPRLKNPTDSDLYDPNADIIAEVKRVILELDGSVLPIQGPPGAGKTFTGARMICALLREHKKVGIA